MALHAAGRPAFTHMTQSMQTVRMMAHPQRIPQQQAFYRDPRFSQHLLKNYGTPPPPGPPPGLPPNPHLRSQAQTGLQLRARQLYAQFQVRNRFGTMVPKPTPRMMMQHSATRFIDGRMTMMPPPVSLRRAVSTPQPQPSSLSLRRPTVQSSARAPPPPPQIQLNGVAQQTPKHQPADTKPS